MVELGGELIENARPADGLLDTKVKFRKNDVVDGTLAVDVSVDCVTTVNSLVVLLSTLIAIDVTLVVAVDDDDEVD